MNCPDCDKEVHGSSCTCGWMKNGVRSTQSPQAYWLMKHCATPGCNTTIRWYYSRPMGEPACKWCQDKANEAQVEA